MNIGIIVFSVTGNTLSVAQRLENSLAAKGHTVNLQRVTAVDDNPNTPSGKQLKDAPDVEPYDAVIFGAPVWGFSLSSVMKAYLSQISSLRGKEAGCFVTQHFPYAWLGGNHAIRQIKEACIAKEAAVFETGVVNWSGREKERQIGKLIDRMTQDLT